MKGSSSIGRRGVAMPSTFDELRSQLTQLSTDERAKLAYFLLDTLDSEEDASDQEIDEERRRGDRAASGGNSLRES